MAWSLITEKRFALAAPDTGLLIVLHYKAWPSRASAEKHGHLPQPGLRPLSGMMPPSPNERP
jgi:hypothetical protein